jgi:hypothetical protein
MRSVRWLSLSCVCLACGLLVGAPGCGSDAVGVEDCREIERARCNAGEACGLVSDVDACRRFYRDHCLHGLALDKSPSRQQLERCTDLIQDVANCVKAVGREVRLQDCGITGRNSLATACDVVSIPEQTEACQFLVPDTPLPDPDAGGDSGATDAAGG